MLDRQFGSPYLRDISTSFLPSRSTRSTGWLTPTPLAFGIFSSSCSAARPRDSQERASVTRQKPAGLTAPRRAMGWLGIWWRGWEPGLGCGACREQVVGIRPTVLGFQPESLPLPIPLPLRECGEECGGAGGRRRVGPRRARRRQCGVGHTGRGSWRSSRVVSSLRSARLD